jgi:hypothetical protein
MGKLLKVNNVTGVADVLLVVLPVKLLIMRRVADVAGFPSASDV